MAQCNSNQQQQQQQPQQQPQIVPNYALLKHDLSPFVSILQQHPICEIIDNHNNKSIIIKPSNDLEDSLNEFERNYPLCTQNRKIAKMIDVAGACRITFIYTTFIYIPLM